MTYRNDADALEARLDVLEKDLADRTRERDEVAHMLAEARDRDAARRWIEDGPRRRRRRRVMLAAAAATMVMLGLVAFFVVRHDSRREHEERVLRDMRQFSADMCTCTGKQCADDVNTKFNDWAQRMAKDDYPDRKPDEEFVKRATEVVKAYAECMSKAIGPATP